MQNSRKANRLARIILYCGVAYVLCAILIYLTSLDVILAHLYKGPLFATLSRFSKHKGSLDFETYMASARLVFSRLSLAVVFGVAASAAFVARGYIGRVVVNFFEFRTSPFNLALFRIAVFGVTLFSQYIDEPATEWFSTFPHQLQVAPHGIGWVLPMVPIDITLVAVATLVFVIACVFGLLGLFTRVSSFVAMAAGVYVLGITQIYGKVSHDHVFLWFMAILAVSPSGDVLSVDALFVSGDRAGAGNVEAPADSVRYGLPLRFASLLIGVIYFFPGFWKFWNAGFAWALSDNLKYQMYSKWMEFDGWTPIFRIDHHPWLYRSMAFGTICFEISFIFLIFFPVMRRLAVFGGYAFHLGSYFFMQILFYDLLIFYVVLFDAVGVLRKLGQRIYRQPLTVFYDEDCGRCRRTIAAIGTLDIFGRITFLGAREGAVVYAQLRPFGDPSQLLHDIHAIRGDQEFRGVKSYVAMAVRIPVLWPLLPFLALPPFSSIANSIYRRVNHSRTCSLAPASREAVPGASLRPMAGLRTITAVGIFLLMGTIYTGVRRITAGWPFACYPTFSFIADEHVTTLEIVAIKSDGEVIPTDPKMLRESFADQRIRGLLEYALDHPGDSYERLHGVWQLYVQKDPRLNAASTVQFYRDTVWVAPEMKSLNPSKRDLICELTN